MTTMPPRFPITTEQIDLVMTRFYAKVRKDPVLGPIFDGHIDNWPEHEAKIAGFWRNAIMFERSYDGNPMRAHMMAGDVRADHFDGWLALLTRCWKPPCPPNPRAHGPALFIVLAAGCGWEYRMCKNLQVMCRCLVRG